MQQLIVNDILKWEISHKETHFQLLLKNWLPWAHILHSDAIRDLVSSALVAPGSPSTQFRPLGQGHVPHRNTGCCGCAAFGLPSLHTLGVFPISFSLQVL